MRVPHDGHTNGVSMRVRPPGYVPERDPMAKVLGLDAETSSVGAWLGFTSGSTVLMVAGMVCASILAWWHTAHAKAVSDLPEEIEIQKDETPPPPPPKDDKTETKQEHTAPPPRVAPPPPPPPSPAQASQVLARDDKLDFTNDKSFTIPVGSAEAYVGGNTSSDGRSTTAQTGPVSSAGAANVGGSLQGIGPPQPQVVKQDLSRKAGPSRGNWSSCPFPAEADTEQIDEANVLVKVDVRADGTPSAAYVVRDPGNGFGRAAQQCAMRMRNYPTALDPDGNAIPGTTPPFNVHFSR